MDSVEEVPAERPWACVPGAGVPGRALGHLGTVHHAGWAAGAGAGSWKPAGSQGLGGEGQSRQNGSAEKNNSCSNLEKSHRTQFHLGGPGLCATQTVCCPRLHLRPRARGSAFPPATAREGPCPPSPAGQKASHTAWHPSSVTCCPPSPCPTPPNPRVLSGPVYAHVPDSSIQISESQEFRDLSLFKHGQPATGVPWGTN